MLRRISRRLSSQAGCTLEVVVQGVVRVVLPTDGDAVTDPTNEWLTPDADLRLGLKCDLGLRPDADVCVSAHTGEGIIELVECVREHLVPAADLASTRPWQFPGLERLLSPDS